MKEVIQSILEENKISTLALETQVIQTLWGGYGELLRVITNENSYILKLIKFPNTQDHPRGWNSNLSHERKVKSYQVEMSWYQSFNSSIKNAYSPQLIACGEIKQTKYIILEDLLAKGFKPKTEITFDEVKLCLKWLALFHRHYLACDPLGLWPVGTYWHLNTRPDELAVLDDQKLKDAAPLIDQKLNNAKYKTIVHGDAKLANFLFNQNETAAVDFQYVGGGVGIKDVAYFLSSIYHEQELFKMEEKCLRYYFSILDNKEVEKEWRELYPFAWCDFYRFLQGWSPGHWKINSYSQQIKDQVLKCL